MFLVHLPKSSICVPVSAINGVVMEMWNWSVILQGTPALSVWVFVLLLGSIHIPLYSLICPQVPFWSESAKSLDGDLGRVDHIGSRVLPEMLNTAALTPAAQGFLRCCCSWSRVLAYPPPSKPGHLILTQRVTLHKYFYRLQCGTLTILNQIKEYKTSYLLLGHRVDMVYIWTQPSLLLKLIAMGKVSTRPSEPAGSGIVHRHSRLQTYRWIPLSQIFLSEREIWALRCSHIVRWQHKQTVWEPEAGTWLNFTEKLRENQ